MDDVDEAGASSERLKNFAAMYSALLAERPYMEMLARHTSMKKAGLSDNERVTADRYLKTHRLNELLNTTGLAK